MEKPLISIITPSYMRENFLIIQYENIKKQTYENWEWIIYDDSPEPSGYFRDLNDPKVKYHHDPARMTVGAKTNWCVDRSLGQVIALFDDDDYYSSGYLEEMFAHLEKGHDIVKLSGFFIYTSVHGLFGYWDLMQKKGTFQRWSAEPVVAFEQQGGHIYWESNHLGYGFSYVFKKEVAVGIRFSDKNWSADTEFIVNAAGTYNIHIFPDKTGLCLHILHKNNLSSCFPQYSLPGFMLEKYFPDLPKELLEA
jgi:glycosyltransferase involved in cell wall biosynthesis